MFEEYILPFVFFITGGLLLLGFYKIRSNTQKEKIKIVKQQEKEKSKTAFLDDIDGMIKNAPAIVQQLDELIEKQKLAGVSEEQLKPLLEKRKIAMIGVQYGDIWNMGGKKVLGVLLPILKGRLGF